MRVRQAAKASGIRAVERAVAILRTFSSSTPELSVSELGRAVGLHKSTVHRLLGTLERTGFVVQDPGTKRYRLGLPLFELGSMVVNTLEVRRVARPYLEEIHRACGETVHLGILDEGEVVYIDKIESTRRVRMYSQVGRRAPAHCTGLGKVLLAQLPDASLAEVIERRGLRRFTSKTITSPKELRDHCALIRQQGYALDTGEHEELIQCAAAAIHDHTGKVVAAVSITSVAAAMDQHRVAEHVFLVQQAARKISEGLGATLHIRQKELPGSPARPATARPLTSGR